LLSTLTIALLATLSPSYGQSLTRIPFADCELDGFGLGGSTELMQDVFGEPERIAISKQPLDDYPDKVYTYDGLTIIFSTSGQSAMSYSVWSDEYQLRGGVGVGSTRAEIEQVLGRGYKDRPSTMAFTILFEFSRRGKITDTSVKIGVDEALLHDMNGVDSKLEYLSYRLIGENGGVSPAMLTFALFDNVAISLLATSQQYEGRAYNWVAN